MNNLYSEESYKNEKKLAKKVLIINLVILFAALLFVGLSWFLVNQKSALAIKIIDCFLLTIVSLVFVYQMLEVYFVKKKHYKFIFSLLTVNRYQDKIVIEEIGARKPIFNHIYGYEIKGKTSNGENFIFLIEEKFINLIKENNEFFVIVAKNVIIGIGDKNE